MLDSRDRVLDGLGVGRQSPQYKRTKAVLDELIREIEVRRTQ